MQDVMCGIMHGRSKLNVFNNEYMLCYRISCYWPKKKRRRSTLKALCELCPVSRFGQSFCNIEVEDKCIVVCGRIIYDTI